MANVYTPEIKAQVIADFEAGESKRGLATKYDIPISTVRVWTGGIGSPVNRVTPETKERLDERVVSLACTGIETIEAILRHARDLTWLQKQNANDLAIFIGVTTDKLTAILAAYERGQDAIHDQAQLASSVSAGG